MKTTTFKLFSLLLLAVLMTLLFLAWMHGAQTLLASVGWHGANFG